MLTRRQKAANAAARNSVMLTRRQKAANAAAGNPVNVPLPPPAEVKKMRKYRKKNASTDEVSPSDGQPGFQTVNGVTPERGFDNREVRLGEGQQMHEKLQMYEQHEQEAREQEEEHERHQARVQEKEREVQQEAHDQQQQQQQQQAREQEQGCEVQQEARDQQQQQQEACDQQQRQQQRQQPHEQQENACEEQQKQAPEQEARREQQQQQSPHEQQQQYEQQRAHEGERKESEGLTVDKLDFFSGKELYYISPDHDDADDVDDNSRAAPVDKLAPEKTSLDFKRTHGKPRPAYGPYAQSGTLSKPVHTANVGTKRVPPHLDLSLMPTKAYKISGQRPRGALALKMPMSFDSHVRTDHLQSTPSGVPPSTSSMRSGAPPRPNMTISPRFMDRPNFKATIPYKLVAIADEEAEKAWREIIEDPDANLAESPTLDDNITNPTATLTATANSQPRSPPSLLPTVSRHGMMRVPTSKLLIAQISSLPTRSAKHARDEQKTINAEGNRRALAEQEAALSRQRHRDDDDDDARDAWDGSMMGEQERGETDGRGSAEEDSGSSGDDYGDVIAQEMRSREQREARGKPNPRTLEDSDEEDDIALADEALSEVDGEARTPRIHKKGKAPARSKATRRPRNPTRTKTSSSRQESPLEPAPPQDSGGEEVRVKRGPIVKRVQEKLDSIVFCFRADVAAVAKEEGGNPEKFFNYVHSKLKIAKESRSDNSWNYFHSWFTKIGKNDFPAYGDLSIDEKRELARNEYQRRILTLPTDQQANLNARRELFKEQYSYMSVTDVAALEESDNPLAAMEPLIKDMNELGIRLSRHGFEAVGAIVSTLINAQAVPILFGASPVAKAFFKMKSMPMDKRFLRAVETGIRMSHIELNGGGNVERPRLLRGGDGDGQRKREECRSNIAAHLAYEFVDCSKRRGENKYDYLTYQNNWRGCGYILYAEGMRIIWPASLSFHMNDYFVKKLSTTECTWLARSLIAYDKKRAQGLVKHDDVSNMLRVEDCRDEMDEILESNQMDLRALANFPIVVNSDDEVLATLSDSPKFLFALGKAQKQDLPDAGDINCQSTAASVYSADEIASKRSSSVHQLYTVPPQQSSTAPSHRRIHTSSHSHSSNPVNLTGPTLPTHRYSADQSCEASLMSSHQQVPTNPELYVELSGNERPSYESRHNPSQLLVPSKGRQDGRPYLQHPYQIKESSRVDGFQAPMKKRKIDDTSFELPQFIQGSSSRPLTGHSSRQKVRNSQYIPKRVPSPIQEDENDVDRDYYQEIARKFYEN